jgi:type IV pilus assembly protein PilN
VSINTNLATRPFYNERTVDLLLLLLAVIVAAATVFNVMRVVQLSRSDTALGTQAARDEERAADLRQQAATLRASIDPKQIEYVSSEARKANDLIDRRTFSWTEIFNRFETTLPEEVRITSVRPKVDSKTGTELTITVVAKDYNEIYQFMEKLEATGAFANMVAREEHPNEQGQIEAALTGRYLAAVAPRGER